jgi:hypothetical protein
MAAPSQRSTRPTIGWQATGARIGGLMRKADSQVNPRHAELLERIEALDASAQ